MYGLGENIPIIRFFYGGIDVSGAVEPFIRDLHGLSGNLIPVFHFLNGLSNVRLFRFISWVHLHGYRHQVCVQEKCLSDNRVVPILFGRSFLLIFIGQIDLEIVIRRIPR